MLGIVVELTYSHTKEAASHCDISKYSQCTGSVQLKAPENLDVRLGADDVSMPQIEMMSRLQLIKCSTWSLLLGVPMSQVSHCLGSAQA